jgi:hypothetical protein
VQVFVEISEGVVAVFIERNITKLSEIARGFHENSRKQFQVLLGIIQDF